MARRCRSNGPAKLGAPCLLAEKRRRRPIPGDISCGQETLSSAFQSMLTSPNQAAQRYSPSTTLSGKIREPMFCTTCGQQLPETARFCSKCGSAVDVDPDATALGEDPDLDGNLETLAPGIAETPRQAPRAIVGLMIRTPPRRPSAPARPRSAPSASLTTTS